MAVLWRDLRIACSRWGDVASPLVFFIIVGSLFPLALSPEATTLRVIGPAVLWVAALLSTLLSLNNLFRADVDDGTMEQLLLREEPLAVVVLAKTLALWLTSATPLVALAPLMGLTYYLPGNALLTLCVTLLLGTPTLCLLGAVGAALTTGLRQASGLLALLVLPLMLPVMMFGARATDLAAGGDDVTGILFLMASMALLAASLAPVAAAAAMRITID
ncbi:Heme exporter protein B [Gammaproteobacteria bacterium]|nr:heme exporter protein CcmB [Gammaproteobacteria bacterium]QOJ31583.1 MAG: heme exporter protein CcmB [Gammaproteobacteria bacterium]CAG0944930.1 Heme exporter protein B [Gammaproteobacteria bacterium]